MPTEMKIKEEQEDTSLLKLSASSMKTFSQCPRKYYYQYIAREPKLKWDHLDLGNLCHKALEIFHEKYMEMKKKPKYSALMKEAFAMAREEYPDMRNELVAEAKDMIKDYLLFLKSSGMPHVRGVETSFNINITQDILVRGFLDRVDVLPQESIMHIVDYKTTRNPKYLDSFQLLIYGLWLQSQYPDVDRYKGSYVLLRHGSKHKSYELNREDIEGVKKKIISLADDIRLNISQDSWEPVPTPLCNWCDFKGICPTQQQGW